MTSEDPEAEVERLRADGQLEAARQIAKKRAAAYREEEESCSFCGEGGEASRAEREAERWEAVVKEIRNLTLLVAPSGN